MRTDTLVLSDSRARVEVHPSQGGAIGRYGMSVGDRLLEIFQTQPDPSRSGVFALGCNVLLPFSNRISGGGFWHEGRFHALTPNLPGSRYPIHGNAFTEAWTVLDADEARVVLELTSSGPGPFRYQAELVYALEDGALRMELKARNTAAMSLPFGIGFHPWFVRTPATRLTMRAAGYWSEDSEHLPRAYHPITEAPDFDFGQGAKLPDGWMNNAFTGWDGVARIEWPDRGLEVEVTAEPPLTTAIIYSPSAKSDSFCLEPVSHSVDAHNGNGPGVAPPQVLAPGEILVAQVLITPTRPSSSG